MISSSSPCLSAQESPATADGLWARGLAVRRADVLGQLAEAGLRMAQALALQVEAQATPDQPPCADPALAFSRIARAVRLTLALQEKMVEAVRLGDRAFSQRRAEQDFAAQASKPARVDRILAKVLDAETHDPETARRLRLDVWERLEDEDAWGTLLDRPVGEIVALICRDLGLTPDYTRWITEAWAGEAMGDLPLMGRDRRRSRQGGDVSMGAEPKAGIAAGAHQHAPTLIAARSVPPHEGRGIAYAAGVELLGRSGF